MPLPLFLGLGAAAAAAAGLLKNQVEKSKEVSATIHDEETRCAEEARGYEMHRTETVLQGKMRKFLLANAFSDSDKQKRPPMTEWGHLPENTHVCATRKYSLFSWGEYSFYTNKAVYYHHKKKATHNFLYFDGINSIDLNTGIVDYGKYHEKRDCTSWESFEKKFIHAVSCIWNMKDETDTSVLEFCFNECGDFRRNLCYFKTSGISNTFEGQCQKLNVPKVLREKFKYITIKSMKDGRMELQFWAYFHKVCNVTFNNDDSEEEIREKEWEQEEREREYEQSIEDAQYAFEELVRMKEIISELFQQSIYKLYGIMFDKDNITFLDEPDFTFEGPSAIDRLENATSSAKAFIDDYAAKNNLHK